jgi:hypothetical protein
MQQWGPVVCVFERDRDIYGGRRAQESERILSKLENLARDTALHALYIRDGWE